MSTACGQRRAICRRARRNSSKGWAGCATATGRPPTPAIWPWALDSAPRLLAGALLPIALSDEAFQTMHLSLPLTWVMPAFRARLFGAFDGAFWPAHRVVAGVAAGGLLLGGWLGGLMGGLLGHGRCIPTPQWRPALDME